MKITKYFILVVSFLVFGCSNDDVDANGAASLEIIDYSPKETFTAEEVIYKLRVLLQQRR